jgi:hypothetical protein
MGRIETINVREIFWTEPHRSWRGATHELGQWLVDFVRQLENIMGLPSRGMARSVSKRCKPFYPGQFSHIVEKYWSHFFDLPSHPDFADESDTSKERMAIFSQALRTFKKTKNWHPQVDAEAPEKGLRIAQEAATSRVHLIADGPNQWEVCRGGTVGAGGPLVGTESSPLSGLPDTCVAGGNPSHT